MNITVGECIQQFLVEQELKGNTVKTIRFYDNNLRYFSDYVGADKPIRELTIADLNGYLLALKKKPKLEGHPFYPAKEDVKLTTTTIQTYVRAVRGFLGWLQQESYIVDNLHQRFKLPKATKKAIEILSDDEIDTIMKAYKTTAEMGLRNACIIALMLDCGLRRNEVLSLDYDNLHISQGVIKVSGKGQKERIVPLGLHTKKLLMKYMGGYRSLPEYDTKRLFISKDLKPMSESSIKMMFQRLRKRTKIDRLHPHILRHTFSTKYLMNGGDIFSLQQILGHTSLEMVRKYSHLASSYVVQNHKKFSPLDNIYAKKQNA